MVKTVFFSTYVNESDIVTNPIEITNDIQHRYSITIPFNKSNSETTSIAIVIMKNPSAAGKILKFKRNSRIQSDDTIYKVLDYLYKLKKPNINKVIIINLMSIYSGTLANIIRKASSVEDLSNIDNLKEISKMIDSLNSNDIIIAAWGGYPNYPKKDAHIEYNISRSYLNDYYDKLINSTVELIGDNTIYNVGGLTKKGFPQHGKWWYDFEDLNPYTITDYAGKKTTAFATIKVPKG